MSWAPSIEKHSNGFAFIDPSLHHNLAGHLRMNRTEVGTFLTWYFEQERGSFGAAGQRKIGGLYFGQPIQEYCHAREIF